jgi:CRISPR type III-B/RAMP module RAMP protein Cmr1
MSIYRIEFITPLFSRGAFEDQPEIRPASIRGQLHWWFRALGSTCNEKTIYDDEKAIFGGVHGGATASKVVVRVIQNGSQANCREFLTLPHKQGGQASPKKGFAPGTTFDLSVLTRHGGLNGQLKAEFDRTLEAWLLLGTLGLRGTRGAGSFCWEPARDAALHYPTSFVQYEDRCNRLLNGSALRFALLKKVYTSTEDARRVVSDTLGGRDDRQGQSDLKGLNHPLGRVFDGRKTSPLRFRITVVGREYRIAAVWDGREKVTGNRPDHLRRLVKLLAQRKPELGKQLAESGLAG